MDAYEAWLVGHDLEPVDKKWSDKARQAAAMAQRNRRKLIVGGAVLGAAASIAHDERNYRRQRSEHDRIGREARAASEARRMRGESRGDWERNRGIRIHGDNSSKAGVEAKSTSGRKRVGRAPDLRPERALGPGRKVKTTRINVPPHRKKKRPGAKGSGPIIDVASRRTPKGALHKELAYGDWLCEHGLADLTGTPPGRTV